MADADRQDRVLSADADAADGAALLAGLADLSLPPARFDHRAHVCAAWHCLREAPPDAATARFTGLLRAYVAHLGAQDKYHHTLTVAALRLIRLRMQQTPEADWPAFAAAHPELLDALPALIGRHYSAGRLASEAARRALVAPDLLPLPDG